MMVIATVVGRRAVRSGGLCGLVFGIFVVAQLRAYSTGYPTQSERDELLAAYGHNAGLNALLGRAGAINQPADYAEWRLLGILGVLGAVWGLLTATRLTRGEEAAGRTAVLLAGRTTRRGAAGQTAAGLAAGLVVLLALTAAGTLTAGLGSGDFGAVAALGLAATIVAPAAVFLAVGLLTSQLVSTRERAAGLAGVLLGGAFAARMVADSSQGPRWASWIGPLGWAEEVRPLTDPDVAAAGLLTGSIVALTALAVTASGRRDTGAGLLPERSVARPRLRLLRGPVGLAIRRSGPGDLAWLAGICAYAWLIGSLARSSAADSTGSADIARYVERLGGDGPLVTAYLGMTFLVLAVLIGFLAAARIAAIRAEETSGHLGTLLVRPVGRIRWLAGRLALCAGLVLLVAVAGGVATWAAIAGQHTGVGFGALIAAGLNVAAPALFVLGLGTLTFGARPRLTRGVTFGYLAWSAIIEVFGAVTPTNRWLLDTAAFAHLAPAPAGGPDWTANGVLVGLGVVAAGVGAVLFSRRDVDG